MDTVVRHSLGVVLPALFLPPSSQLLGIPVYRPLVAGISSVRELQGVGHVENSHIGRRRFQVRYAATGEKSRSSTRNGFTKDEPRDYYEVLGVPVAASHAEIRKAYRLLQKIHHPDIAGAEGHRVTLLLNEAYQTLMDESLRGAYNKAHSHKAAMREAGHTSFSGSPYSTWMGPDRPQGIFVDENACIGCRECVCAASKTFSMVDSEGTARVSTQWGDPEPLIKVAIDSCPVNCIHYVEREDLSVLEYLIRPLQRQGNGVYGGEWGRPRNVFMAARTFKRQMEEKKARPGSTGPTGNETPAQRQARMDAELKIRAGAFWRLWSWGMRPMFWQQEETSGQKQQGDGLGKEWPWKGLFGRSSTSELLKFPVTPAEVPKVVARVQDWAVTFASSSELPLPMPFKTDLLPNGVQLTLITTDNGMLSSIGVLVATVEQTKKDSTNAEKAALGDPFVTVDEFEVDDGDFYFTVRREGAIGTRALPGEGRILKLMKDALAGRDSAYSSYGLPRN